MNPYQRQTVAVWSIGAGALACGLALWLLFPLASLLAAYLVVAAIIALWGYLRRYNTQWSDVAGAQIRELAQQRAIAEYDREIARRSSQRPSSDPISDPRSPGDAAIKGPHA
jgi:membrane protein implicated in regulation of membrane protease activity